MTTATPPALEVVQTVAGLRELLGPKRRDGRTIGFVPTMGALHDGHAALLRTARDECDVLVASCYVNPTQFGAGEDLDRYPRTPEHDREVARSAGVDVLWLPTDADVYGADPGESVGIDVGRIGTVLEGAARPGHFDGVATVVVRLLGAVGPDVLYLGRKDHQQVAVLRRVVDDLLLAVAIREVDTVREADGLAMSSRNAYLDADERRAALAIPRALDAAVAACAAGVRDAPTLRDAALDELARGSRIDVDYVELVRAGSVDSIDAVDEHGAVLLVAARIGSTRLIDNTHLPAGSPRTERP